VNHLMMRSCLGANGNPIAFVLCASLTLQYAGRICTERLSHQGDWSALEGRRSTTERCPVQRGGRRTSIRRCTVGAAAGLALLLAAAPAHGGALYSVNNLSDELVKIDPATGASTVVGATGTSAITGLAFDTATGTIFGVETNLDQLVTIDPATAATSIVAGSSLPFALAGATFHPDTGELYGIHAFVGDLMTIDTTTGLATLVGPTGFDNGFSSLTFATIPAPGGLAAVAFGASAFIVRRRR